MSIYKALTKQSFKLYLNNGTTASGKLKTVTVSLPKLKQSTAFTDTDLNKAQNIVNALTLCLAKNLEYEYFNQTYTVENE